VSRRLALVADPFTGRVIGGWVLSGAFLYWITARHARSISKERIVNFEEMGLNDASRTPISAKTSALF
jgi:hypothetical protein